MESVSSQSVAEHTCPVTLGEVRNCTMQMQRTDCLVRRQEHKTQDITHQEVGKPFLTFLIDVRPSRAWSDSGVNAIAHLPDLAS